MTDNQVVFIYKHYFSHADDAAHLKGTHETKGPLRTKNKVLDQKRLFPLFRQIAGEKGIMDLGVPVPPVADQIWKLRFDRPPNS